ncbi:hypothetical protein [Brevibacillus choshinensis]|uniref:hypothetical protein n=1 Tax=Brevibacillus choshinensis TaxID=54911 RepID=UPI00191C4ECF|nr:hypothetical protein [Brevibacillus choshinensis]
MQGSTSDPVAILEALRTSGVQCGGTGAKRSFPRLARMCSSLLLSTDRRFAKQVIAGACRSAHRDRGAGFSS